LVALRFLLRFEAPAHAGEIVGGRAFSRREMAIAGKMEVAAGIVAQRG